VDQRAGDLARAPTFILREDSPLDQRTDEAMLFHQMMRGNLVARGQVPVAVRRFALYGHNHASSWIRNAAQVRRARLPMRERTIRISAQT
jgi:hypothetical protein